MTDQDEIGSVIDRYLLSLDERGFDEDWARSFFTEDARAETPRGNPEGIVAIVDTTRESVGSFERTQHNGFNYVVDVDGDRAVARWNSIMVHVHRAALQPRAHLVVGGRWTGELVRTPGGWRFRWLAVDPLWTMGEPPVLVTTPEQTTS